MYATEVPDGYERISFGEMKPDELQERANVAVPPEIAALEGKKIFIKGYIRPDSIKVPRGIKEFLLVRDNNQCCFGDMSTVQFYDQVQVRMKGDLTVDYTPGLYRMGGTLSIEERNAAPGSPGTVYTLEADHAE